MVTLQLENIFDLEGSLFNGSIVKNIINLGFFESLKELEDSLTLATTDYSYVLLKNETLLQSLLVEDVKCALEQLFLLESSRNKLNVYIGQTSDYLVVVL